MLTETSDDRSSSGKRRSTSVRRPTLLSTTTTTTSKVLHKPTKDRLELNVLCFVELNAFFPRAHTAIRELEEDDKGVVEALAALQQPVLLLSTTKKIHRVQYRSHLHSSHPLRVHVPLKCNLDR